MTGEGGLPNEERIREPFEFMRLDGKPRPVPGAREVLVVVKASGVGPWDRLVHAIGA